MMTLSDLDGRIDTLAQWMHEAKRLVVFTGAGISTESGLPDFRGPDGVWTRQAKGMTTEWPDLSLTEPNAGHMAIVELQKLGKLTFLISQNVDNLHLRSGIQPGSLAELHGNFALLRCRRCGTKVDIADGGSICACGGELVSSVVNFGDPMPQQDLALSYQYSQNCDLFVVVGSSLVVSPAADMPQVAYESGVRLVIINQGETPLDRLAHLRFEESIGEVWPPAVDRLKELMKQA